MKWHSFSRSVLAAFLLPLLLLAGTAATMEAMQALEAMQEPDAGFEEVVAVGYVLVPVVVRTPSGFADRLDKEDFTLRVDGRKVAIESFERRAEAPASLVFLQDLSGSMATNSKLDVSRRALDYFLDRSLPGDEFALATFASGTGQIDVPFTTDRLPLDETSRRWRGWGTTALHDAIAWLPDIAEGAKNPRRFALLITDGEDNASQIPPEAARELVRRAQVPVYVLGLEAGNPFELNREGEKLYRYADVLQLLALQSGGRYYPISVPQDLDLTLQAISEDLRHQYVLGFSTGAGASAYRKIEVQVSGKERSVFSRRGYQGLPPAGPS